MSIVVITYNGGTTIGRTIESLLAQTYSPHRFEIIVVDDGSTDTTAEVVAPYPVRYHFQPNAGISQARNAGIGLCNGEVYICMDDDVIVSPNFIADLAAVYRINSKLAGVSGVMEVPQTLDTIAQTYISANSQGPAARNTAKVRFGILGRLWAYLRSHSLQAPTLADLVEVEELYGANASYPVEVLQAVEGWDVNMSGIEDRDLSARIRAKYPERAFVAVASAKLIHDPDMSLRSYLLRGWRRGPVNLDFYRSQAMIPPIFPFPVILLLLSLVVLALNPALLPLAILLVPQALYYWWGLQALRLRQPVYLLFPYFQAAEEGLIILGLLRGYLNRDRSYRG